MVDLEILHPPLRASVGALLDGLNTIADERRATLDSVATWMTTQRSAHRPIRLTFICTHNSRRSHIAQLWAAAAAQAFGVPAETFSGGTEVTAFNPRAVAAMIRAGFAIEAQAPSANPVYVATFGPSAPPQQLFSKVYDAESNPNEDFAAIMTCGQADEACPVVLGASARFVTAYEDPKAADGRPDEATVYDTRVAQIGRELLYTFQRVAGADA